MELKKGRYISHLWFVDSKERDKDWMCWLYRDPGEDWVLEYRFRYYKDKKAHDSEDQKSFYETSISQAMLEADVVRRVDILAGMTEATYKGALWKVPIQSDEPMVAVVAINKEPWMHVKFEPAPS
jgi:hypothetical protein